MTARLLHGRPLAETINTTSKARASALELRGLSPRLAVVSVGADPAGNAYAQRLARAGRELRIDVRHTALSRDTAEGQLVTVLEGLAAEREVNGIILLTPLPGALDEAHIVDHIAVEKDVEGMHPFNVGFLADGRPRFVPSTADAIVELLKFHEIPLRGAHAVVIGRSTVIGRPAAYLLLKEDATVTMAHKQTTDLGRFTRQADVVVVGVGRERFLTGDMLSPGVTVVDAGINVSPAGLRGDVEAESVSRVAGALSPVPGGLGAVTVALLLRNVLSAAEK
ncbi:MAG: bifunctional 5,10-methylenetetrahydrofolate dehydrogenase/5,10-methenyltetrahydrofolate cyclohydrolase, partial [Candidatus Limnocylindria bacterium]